MEASTPRQNLGDAQHAHVLHADDYARWQGALGAYAHHTKPGWLQRCGLTPLELDEIVVAIGRALGRRLLTRDQLADEVTRVVGSCELGNVLRQGWGWMLKPAAFRGQLCFGPNIGANVRFTRPDVWLGRALRSDSQAGWIDLTRRFLAAYGPATRIDYSRWSGAPLAHADEMLRSLGSGVTEISLAGEKAWVLSADLDELRAAEASGTVRLLPAFDQFVLAASPHMQNLIPADIARISFGRKAGFCRCCWLMGGLTGSGRTNVTGGGLRCGYGRSSD